MNGKLQKISNEISAVKLHNVSLRFTRIRNSHRTLKGELINKLAFARDANIFGKAPSDAFTALNNVSFNVRRGDSVGIIGRNGAGKTTLLRVISGVYKPDTGSVYINGTLSSLLSLGAGFEPELSGLDNIYISSMFLGLNKKDVDAILQDIIDFADIGEFINQPIKVYSSGMKARLGFSVSYFIKRDILLIDEILGVGDKNFRKKSKEAILSLFNENKTIILVSHNLDSILEMCNKCIWIEGGSVVMYGDTGLVVKEYTSQ